jgi:hypothetical protein
MFNIDLDRLMKEPIYAFDFQFMIGDIQDYLDFSEGNIESHYLSELQSIKARSEAGDLEDIPDYDYWSHLEDGAAHRFKVSLPLRIRYGALLALVTAVEWSMESFCQLLIVPVEKRPNEKNKTVHALEVMCKRVELVRADTVANFEALVRIRNCIAHSAGLQKDDQFQVKLPAAIQKLEGFSLASWHFFGSHIAIEKGALSKYIEEMKLLIVDIHRAAHERGLFKQGRVGKA